MRTIEPAYPGEHLLEILEGLGITPNRLAKIIYVPEIRIHDIVHGRRSITADTAFVGDFRSIRYHTMPYACKWKYRSARTEGSRRPIGYWG